MIAPGNRVVGLVFFDRVDVPLRAQAGRFQAHRTGSGADVPDHAVGAQLQPRQADRAHFLLGDQAIFRPPLFELDVGQAKAHRLRGRPHAPQQHDVERGEVHVGRLLRAELGHDALVRLQQVFRYCHHEVVAQPFGEQQARDAVGTVVRAGQHQQAGMRAQGLCQAIQAVPRRAAALPLAGVARVNRDDARIVPGQADPGAGQL